MKLSAPFAPAALIYLFWYYLEMNLEDNLAVYQLGSYEGKQLFKERVAVSLLLNFRRATMSCGFQCDIGSSKNWGINYAS